MAGKPCSSQWSPATFVLFLKTAGDKSMEEDKKANQRMQQQIKQILSSWCVTKKPKH